MNRNTLFSALSLTLLCACAGFQLTPASTTGQTTVSEVVVEAGADLDDDKREALAEYAVPTHMRDAIAASFPRGEGPTLRVTITQFRTGRFGPTRMQVRADVVGLDGQVLRSAEAEASAMIGASTTSKLRKVAQSVVDQVVAEVSAS